MGELFWAIATAVFAILEIIIPGLVTIWLSLAALVLTGLSFFMRNPVVEVFIFSVLSVIFVIFTRPVLKNYIEKSKKTNFNSKMIGNEIKIEEILNLTNSKKEYEVKFKGVIWKGISEDVFKKNEIAKIKGFVGNKIILEKSYIITINHYFTCFFCSFSAKSNKNCARIKSLHYRKTGEILSIIRFWIKFYKSFF